MTIGIKKKEKAAEEPKPRREDYKKGFNEPGPDGLYNLLPKQISGQGTYMLCNCGQTAVPKHDSIGGVTRFWCQVCGLDLSLSAADDYMREHKDD